MRTVYKFDFNIGDHVTFAMPKGSIVLSVQVQHDKIKLWALCNSEEKEYENRFFRLAGTGHPIKENIKSFIGTVQMLSGNFVCHVFEIYE